MENSITEDNSIEQLVIEISEKEWIETYHDPSPTELARIFPEAQQWVRKKLSSLKKKYRREESYRAELLQEKLELLYQNDRIKDKSVFSWMLEQYIYSIDIQQMAKEIKQFETQARIFYWLKQSPIHLKGSIDEITIQRARETPIANYLKVNRAGFALCPFHGEKTPSLKVYPNNKWWCFGCNTGGDVIDLVIKQQGLDFLSAVKMLAC